MTATKEPDDIRVKMTVTLSRRAREILWATAEANGVTASAVVDMLARCLEDDVPLVNPEVKERIHAAELG